MHLVTRIAGISLRSTLCAALGGVLTLAMPAQATLLSMADQSQLSSWLGQGPLSLNLLFEKTAGKTAADFHAAADKKGRTFTVMQAFDASGGEWLIGGYNPQSWSSSGGFNVTPNDADRTAFLFNLTKGIRFSQLPVLAGDDYGQYQTMNSAQYGPSFGMGADLAVPFDLTNGGVSALLSYNDGIHEQNPFTSLLDGSPYTNQPNVRYGAIEVYAVNLVPEPASGWLVAGGLGVLAAAGWRRRARAGRQRKAAA